MPHDDDYSSISRDRGGAGAGGGDDPTAGLGGSDDDDSGGGRGRDDDDDDFSSITRNRGGAGAGGGDEPTAGLGGSDDDDPVGGGSTGRDPEPDPDPVSTTVGSITRDRGGESVVTESFDAPTGGTIGDDAGDDPATAGVPDPDPVSTTVDTADPPEVGSVTRNRGGIGVVVTESFDAPEGGTIGNAAGSDPAMSGVLDRVSTEFSDVAGRVGDAAAFASPATELDRVLPGEPVERTVRGVNEGAANALNPGDIVGGVVGLNQRVARDAERVARGEGGRVVEDAREDVVGAAAGTAASLRSDPVGSGSRLAGGLAGGALAGTALSRTARSVETDPSAADPVPSGRSNVGTDGLGSILDEDTARQLEGRDTSVDRSPTDTDTDTATADTDTGGLPLRDDIADAGGVRRLLDEQRAGIRDFVGDERGQTGVPRPRSPSSDTDSGTGTGTDRVSDNLVQQSLERQQRAGQRSVEGGDFEGVGDPFGSGSRAGDFGEGRFNRDPDGGSGGSGGSGFGFNGFDASGGAGLGGLNAVNDPTGITDFDDAETGAGPADTVGGGVAGGDVRLGELADANDPTGITPDDDVDVGTEQPPALDQPTDTDQPPGLDQPTDTDTDQLLEPIPLRGTTTVGTQQSPGATSPPTFATPELTEPTVPTTTTTSISSPGSPRPPRVTPRPRPDPEPKQDDDDEPAPVALGIEADRFGTGFLSGEEALDDFLRR